MSGVSIRSRVTRSGEKRYMVRYRRGGRDTQVESAGTFPTQREALLRARLVEDWLASGLNPRVELARKLTPTRTVAEAWGSWIESRRNVAARTRDGYRQRAVRLLKDWGDRPIDELTVQEMIEWVGRLTDEYQPGTVRLFMVQLRMILDFDGGPNVARDRRVELPRVVRKEPNPPDSPDVEALFAGLTKRTRLPVVAMEQLGSRVTETLALTLDDIGEGRIRFRREESKQGHGRWVECDPVLSDALRERVPFGVRRSSVGESMRLAAGFGPHQLRHRRATLWYQQNVGPVELARRLGHARPSMSLDVYSHVKPLREVDRHVLVSALR